jgi:hypothetical protein
VRDRARLFVIDVLATKTLHLLQVVFLLNAKELPTPMSVQTIDPTITLIAPP